MIKYNLKCYPDLLQHFDIAVADTPNNPRLSRIDEVYGNGGTHDLLFSNLTSVFADCGFDYQTSVEHAVEESINLLCNGYRALRIWEVIYFLKKFQSGGYGIMSRVFNIQQFGKAVREFFIERNIQREQDDRKRKQAEREASFARSVSRAEYERMKANGEI